MVDDMKAAASHAAQGLPLPCVLILLASIDTPHERNQLGLVSLPHCELTHVVFMHYCCADVKRILSQTQPEILRV